MIEFRYIDLERGRMQPSRDVADGDDFVQIMGPEVEFFLRSLREPDRWIESVSESLEIGSSEILRRTHVSLRVPRDWDDVDRPHRFFLPVWSPYRGEPFNYKIASTSTRVKQVSHESHVRICEVALAYRLYTLWKNSFPPEARRVEFEAHMVELWRDVVGIPRLSRVEAEKVFSKYFDVEKRRLRKFENWDNLATSGKYENNLCVLARRLASRYYVILEVAFDDSGQADFDLESIETWNERKKFSSGGGIFSSAGRTLRKWAPHAQAPSEISVHLPWAKKTGRYDLSVPAPEGYFLGKHVVNHQRDKEAPIPWQTWSHEVTTESRRSDESQPLSAHWSSTSSAGRSLRLHIENGYVEGAKLWLGAHVLELPGRWTSRAFVSALLWLTGMMGVVLGALVARGSVLAYAALVFAALAAVTPMLLRAPSAALYSVPVVARSLPFAGVVSSIFLVLWLLVVEALFDGGSRGLADLSVWELVATQGWIFAIGAMVFVVGVLLRRRRGLLYAYKATLEVRFVADGVAYGVGGTPLNEGEC